LAHVSELGAHWRVPIVPPPTRPGTQRPPGILRTHGGASHDALLNDLVLVRPRYAVRKPAPRKGKREWLGRGSPQRAMQHCAQKEPLSRCVNLRFLLIGAELG